jgi:lipopolysaccharide transport system permease protein
MKQGNNDMDIVDQQWDLIIKPNRRWFDLRLADIYRHRDLLFLFVKRDFVSVYKQTILGPLWFFLQPLLMTITFAVIFGKIAGIGTEGIPYMPFYLAGITLWNFFSETLTKASDTFSTNANIFGKVYFPRFIVPLSIVISNLIKLAVQFLLFFVFWAVFVWRGSIEPNWTMMWLVPILILNMGILGLAIGTIVTSVTTKYRDLKFLVQFGVQLLMYASPIVYPLSLVSDRYRILIQLNPVTPMIESFKAAFLGTHGHSMWALGLSILNTILLFFLSLLIFNKVEKSFMDTV